MVLVLLTDFYTLRRDVEAISERAEEIRASAGLQQLEEELAALEMKAADSSFWDDRAKAQETLLARTDVKDKIKLLTDFKTQVRLPFLFVFWFSLPPFFPLCIFWFFFYYVNYTSCIISNTRFSID